MVTKLTSKQMKSMGLPRDLGIKPYESDEKKIEWVDVDGNPIRWTASFDVALGFYDYGTRRYVKEKGEVCSQLIGGRRYGIIEERYGIGKLQVETHPMIVTNRPGHLQNHQSLDLYPHGQVVQLETILKYPFFDIDDTIKGYELYTSPRETPLPERTEVKGVIIGTYDEEITHKRFLNKDEKTNRRMIFVSELYAVVHDGKILQTLPNSYYWKQHKRLYFDDNGVPKDDASYLIMIERWEKKFPEAEELLKKIVAEKNSL